MYVKKKLILWAAIFALAIPLLLVGTASARYASDGAVQDGVTGGWKAPADGVCVLGVHMDGTLDVDLTITNKRDCDAKLVTAPTTSAACTDSDAVGNDGAKHARAGSNTCVTVDGSRIVTGTISLKDLDRNAKICEAKGGFLANNSTAVDQTQPMCIAYGWQFRGQDADGAPLTFGTTGTPAATANGGFCYTSLVTGITPTTACPSTSTDVRTKLGYAVSGSNCNYAYGIVGATSATTTNVDGTTRAAGTSVDLTAYTMGECIAQGFSWNNWVQKDGTTTTPSATIATFDHNKRASGSDREGCLHCHSSVNQQNGPVERWKDSYLKTGHKNMLRKVTAGKNWAGPNASGVLEIYTDYAAGTINWGTLGNGDATATVSGVAKPLLFIFGDWMAPAPAGLDVVVDMSGSAKYNGTSNYSCAACHTTGWSNSAAGLCSISSNTNQTACESAGGAWVPTTGVQGVVGQEPAASFPGITFTGAGNWDLDGIQCARCHGSITPNPTGGSGHQNGVYSSGANINNLCYGCHQSPAKTANGTGAAIDTANPQNIPVKLVGTDREFSGHVLGNSFLNSPHAKFSGTITPNSLGKWDIVAGGTYASTFGGKACFQSPTSSSPAMTKADGTEIEGKDECDALYGAGSWRTDLAGQGNCTTCHDVHNSLFTAGQEHHALRRECDTCHHDTAGNLYASSGVPQAALVNHPSGTNTPFDTEQHVSSCEACHMPKATSGGFPMHLWRINVDAAYSTFPTVTEFNAGMKIGNSAADGTYTPAVWVDLDLACGQCHLSGPATNLFTKAQMAVAAENMHSAGTGSAVAITNADCLTCHTGIVPGTNHHGVHSDCTDCHATNHSAAVPDKTNNAFCLTCHTNTGPYAVHHAVSAVAAQCVSCHTIPGVTVPAMNPADRTSVYTACQLCHATAQGTKRALIISGTGDNHHRGSGTTTARSVASCLYCHDKGKPFGNTSTEVMLDAPNADTCAGACHGYTNPADPTFEHHTGVCLSCHVPGADGRNYGAPGVTEAGRWPVASWQNCTACHSAIVTAQETTHHSGTCITCHGTMGGEPAGACVTCHTTKSMSLNHLTGTPYPATCTSCHVAGVTPAVSMCTGCHAMTTSKNARYAAGLHNSVPVPSFTWIASTTTPYTVHVDSSASLNCPTRTWNFGGGTGNTTAVATDVTYSGPTTTTVTLTCGTVSTAQMIFTRATTTVRPTLIPSGTATAGDGFLVTFVDTSAASGSGSGTIRIQWGDGSSGIESRGTTTTHRYHLARKYSIRLTVLDDGNAGQYPRQTKSVTIPVMVYRITVSGAVTQPTSTLDTTPLPLAGVKMSLKAGDKTLKTAITRADGTYSFLNVVPISALRTSRTLTVIPSEYTIVPTKRYGQLVSGVTQTWYTFVPPSLITTATTTATMSAISANEPRNR